MRLMSSNSWERIFTTIRNLFHTFMFYILKSAYLYYSRGFFLNKFFFFFGVRKAFDTIWPKSITDPTSVMEYQRPPPDFIADFFTGLRLTVQVGSTVSSYHPFCTGVPQESVISSAVQSRLLWSHPWNPVASPRWPLWGWPFILVSYSVSIGEFLLQSIITLGKPKRTQYLNSQIRNPSTSVVYSHAIINKVSTSMKVLSGIWGHLPKSHIWLVINMETTHPNPKTIMLPLPKLV